MTKTNKQIILLLIIAFILFNIPILLSAFFNDQMTAASGDFYISMFYNTINILLIGVSITCFIAAIILLIRNNN